MTSMTVKELKEILSKYNDYDYVTIASYSNSGEYDAVGELTIKDDLIMQCDEVLDLTEW